LAEHLSELVEDRAALAKRPSGQNASQGQQKAAVG